ncbi:hypothetical protein JW826_04730 [Candidatus Woesearchaeota archaeon]|nr:hypothetical protein [Candidatus Woesearchaeota archaeon]
MKKLISFIKEFTKKDVPELSGVERIGRQYFLMNKELKQARDELGKMTPFSAGLSFGSLEGNKFKPGFPLLDLIARYTDRIAVADSKGEIMFLYHNSITADNLLTQKQEPESGLLLVENERGEVLGYGEAKKDRQGKKIIKNILDRSDFLKREKR